jgi:hypothetical protein
MGFDDVTKTFTAEDEVWDTLLANKPTYARYRDTPVEFYDLLHELFLATSCGATGMQAESVAQKASRAKSREREPAADRDPKRRKKTPSTAEAILEVASVVKIAVMDSKTKILTKAEEALEDWATRDDDDRDGITIETLAAASDTFAQDTVIARSFACKRETLQLAWLHQLQDKLKAGQGNNETNRRARSPSWTDWSD